MKVRRPRQHRKYVLSRLIASEGWTRGAELGVLRGDTFIYLLRRHPDLSMVGVDTWAPDWSQEDTRAEGGRTYAEHPLEGYYNALRATISANGWSPRATLMRATTVAAARRVRNASLDFVFIDADHTYEGASADIDGWQRKVRPGGMLLGHDHNPERFPGVVRAVSERFDNIELFDDHVWGVRL